MTKKQKQAAALAKRKATLAAKAAAIKEEEEEEDESEEIEAEGGAGSGPTAPSKKGSVRFFNMANTRNIDLHDGRVLISDRSTRKSTAGKPVVPVVNIRRSQHASEVAALFAKMSSWAVSRDPGYLTRVLTRVKTDPHYLDKHLTAKESEVMAAPRTITMLERQVALVDKE